MLIGVHGLYKKARRMAGFLLVLRHDTHPKLIELGFMGELSYSHALAKGEFGRMKSEFGLVA